MRSFARSAHISSADMARPLACLEASQNSARLRMKGGHTGTSRRKEKRDTGRSIRPLFGNEGADAETRRARSGSRGLPDMTTEARGGREDVLQQPFHPPLAIRSSFGHADLRDLDDIGGWAWNVI